MGGLYDKFPIATLSLGIISTFVRRRTKNRKPLSKWHIETEKSKLQGRILRGKYGDKNEEIWDKHIHVAGYFVLIRACTHK
jgi:hypothetical protein